MTRSERSGRKAPPTDESAEDETSGGGVREIRPGGDIGCVGKCREGAMVIGAVEQRHIPQGWRKVKVAMDSGACLSV